MWGGRFKGALHPELDRFQRSIDFDRRLYRYDVAGSRAHARGLKAAGLLEAEHLDALERGLDAVLDELASGRFEFLPTDEDIHTAVERRLGELVGEVAGRLHAGRSRNDQVALDLRMFCREAAADLAIELAALIAALARQAREHADWPMPGYTHLQRAQPVSVGHHLLAYAEPLIRDAKRLRHAYEAADEMPLGSGALAGSTLPLRREVVARELGFDRLTSNSMDAVSDRDFVLELCFACLSIALHLSRLGEDVVLWSTAEFGFVQLVDEIATGSSLMPQKKNPDIAELIRGRSGRAVGAFSQLVTVLKGLPMTYDKDLQEDKIAVFSAVDNAADCLRATRLMVDRLVFDRERMLAALADPGLFATDTADRLVESGMPFREAHHEVGRQVGEGVHQPDLDPSRALRRRDLKGAPHPDRVRERAAVALQVSAGLSHWAEANPPIRW